MRGCTCVLNSGTLERLRNVHPHDANLQHATTRERILLRDHCCSIPADSVTFPHEGLLVDSRARHLMPTDRHFVPVTVSGNGSCRFNAVSVSLYGNESKAVEFRALTALALIQHGELAMFTWGPTQTSQISAPSARPWQTA